MNKFDYEIEHNFIENDCVTQYQAFDKMKKHFGPAKHNFKYTYSYNEQSVSDIEKIKIRGMHYKLYNQAKNKYFNLDGKLDYYSPQYMKDKDHIVEIEMSLRDAYKLFTGKEL